MPRYAARAAMPPRVLLAMPAMSPRYARRKRASRRRFARIDVVIHAIFMSRVAFVCREWRASDKRQSGYGKSAKIMMTLMLFGSNARRA